MNLAAMLANTKMSETQVIRVMVLRKNIMTRNYLNKSELTITENELEKAKFELDREKNIKAKDVIINELKEIIFKNKKIIDEKNSKYGINILLQKVKFIKIELYHLTQDKYNHSSNDFDTSDRIKDLEIEKVKLLNSVMSKNHSIKC